MKSGILITGGSGLLGVNWAAAVKHCYSVTLAMHSRHIRMDGVTCRVVQLDSVDLVEAAIQESRAEVVVHSAAMTNVEACEIAPQAAYHANVEIARIVACACKLRGAKLVHISTDHVFSGRDSMMDERVSVQPINVYAKTKAEAEDVVLGICPEAIVVRTNFFGWGLPYRQSFSDAILDALILRRKIRLFTDAYFTPILIRPLVSATHGLVDKHSSGVFHLAGDERLSKYEFGLRIAKAFDLDTGLIEPISLADRKDLVSRPLDTSLSNKKMREMLSPERPNLSIDGQLDQLIAERANLPLKQVLSVKTPGE